MALGVVTLNGERWYPLYDKNGRSINTCGRKIYASESRSLAFQKIAQSAQKSFDQLCLQKAIISLKGDGVAKSHGSGDASGDRMLPFERGQLIFQLREGNIYLKDVHFDSGKPNSRSEAKMLQDSLNRFSKHLFLNISVAETGNRVNINIKGTVQADTPAAAKQFVAGVKRYWETSVNGADGKTYISSVSLAHALFGGDIELNIIDGMEKYRASAHKGGKGVYIWRLAENFELTSAHEFGHVIGFADQYQDLGSQSVAYPGHKENIMGTGDTVGAYHLRALALKYK